MPRFEVGKLLRGDSKLAKLAPHLRGKRLTYYNGAFSPPSLAHAHIMAVCRANADCLWVEPDPPTQWKRSWLAQTHEARLEMCETILDRGADAAGAGAAGVGTLRRDLGEQVGDSRLLFETLRELVGPDGELRWAVGSDVMLGMKGWREKAASFFKRHGGPLDSAIVFVRSRHPHMAAETTAAFVEVLGGKLGVGELCLHTMPPSLAHLSSGKLRHLIRRRRVGECTAKDFALEGRQLTDAAIIEFLEKRQDLIDIYGQQAEEAAHNGDFL